MMVWSVFLSWFKVNTLVLDIYAFFSYPLQHGFGTQLQLLWWGMMGAGFYSLWDARNSIDFDEHHIIADYLICSSKLQIREFKRSRVRAPSRVGMGWVFFFFFLKKKKKKKKSCKFERLILGVLELCVT
ncbi:hypothetical protein RchiOBHm_Chr4g0397541 [Rosa chinensis]|uniref:Uncharacterized protein n=1 Tax=Rosa chinensis TaxID=74649 RepID=A0A2P6QS26_ROSCH|nr:hypothetical protein RchiOBHm_Chr4g0397541 [Rosa chinensis]